MKARVKAALHRYSAFGKIAEIAGKRRELFAKRIVSTEASIKKVKNELRQGKGLETPAKLDDLHQLLAIDESSLKRQQGKHAFWQKRYVWATDRHEQWGNILRRRRTALRRWLRIHRTYGAGGFAPTSFWVRQRVDQGDDIEIKLGKHLRAPGDGEVIQWAHDGPFPDGFGDPYAVVNFTTGPFSGLGFPIYLGHVNEEVPPPGRKIKEGDRIGKVTNSQNPGLGWAEIGPWPPEPWDGVSQPAPGQKIAHLFTEVRG